MKKSKFVLFLTLSTLGVLTSCNSKEAKKTEEIDTDIINWDKEVLGEDKVDPTDDNYRTFYEIQIQMEMVMAI